MSWREGISSFIEAITSREPNREMQNQSGQHGHRKQSKYPIYSSGFFHSITWECTNCGQEFYEYRDDQRLTCHNCNTEYQLTEDDFPELLRAKCWSCKEISENIGGFRAENIRFDCPYCEFEWESSRW